MGALRNLRELRLAHCVKVNDFAFLALPEHLTFDSLRILDLTACENVRDDAVERIVNSAPRLRNLVLAKCKHITNRSVSAICKLGKNLHYIHLGHCANITDSAVIQLIKSCNRMRYVDLACCHHLTDTSVQQLATLPKLRRIGLVKCQLITNRSIFALARPKVPHNPLGISSLERVHLSYCGLLTTEVGRKRIKQSREANILGDPRAPAKLSAPHPPQPHRRAGIPPRRAHCLLPRRASRIHPTTARTLLRLQRRRRQPSPRLPEPNHAPVP